jgi:hypothetical protein
MNINVFKCQSWRCGHSIRGETKELVANISSAQKPERRTRLAEECSYNFNLCLIRPFVASAPVFTSAGSYHPPLHLRSEGSPDPVPNWIRF